MMICIVIGLAHGSSDRPQLDAIIQINSDYLTTGTLAITVECKSRYKMFFHGNTYENIKWTFFSGLDAFTPQMSVGIYTSPNVVMILQMPWYVMQPGNEEAQC